MGLFRRKRANAAAYPEQDVAEERFEREEEGEVGGRVGHAGARGRWSTRSHDTTEEEKLELRAMADPESDTAEELFIRSEHDAEERGRWGELPR